MVFSSGVFLSWILLIFQFKLCLGIDGAINIRYIVMRSRIQIPLIWYIAVADRFTGTEITYIQVTLLIIQNCVTLSITYLGYLYISRQNRVCIPIFSMLTFDLVFSICQEKKLSFVEMWGGGGCMVAICSPSPKME